MTLTLRTKLISAGVAGAALLAGYYGWSHLHSNGPGEAFASGNGRIEATEIDVAAKLPGRLQDILVSEGDFVSAGQTLGHMQVLSLEAQRAEATANLRHAEAGGASA